MSHISPFNFSDYKDFLKAAIAGNKAERAFQTKLAEHGGIQKSFLSQVMNSHVHLLPDHAAAMSAFLALSEAEAAYFVDLVALARAGSSSLKAILKKRMSSLKAAQANPTERFKWPELEAKVQEIYYSSWHWGAIHMLVSIPKYKSVAAIAERLGLPARVVEEALAGLEKMKLVSPAKGGWATTGNYTYLPNFSPMTSANHMNWRQRALENVQSMDETALHYSAAFTLSQADFFELKELIVEFIERMNQKISPSAPEEAAAFTCDFFCL
jgi:uncharacterized protein (TIGR02147 family)